MGRHRKHREGIEDFTVSRNLCILTVWLVLSISGLIGVSSSGHQDKSRIYSADIPTNKEHEISILIGARSETGDKIIGIQADGDEGSSGNSSSGGSEDDVGEASISLDKCGPGAQCCYQYTWPGYEPTIPEAENATCEYLRKKRKDDTIACFDPMVFTKSRGEKVIGSPPNFTELRDNAISNKHNIVCNMNAKTCVKLTYYNDEKKMANQTKFCGLVTDNNDKQIKKGCFKQKVGGMVREVCVCDTNLCNSGFAKFPSKLSIIVAILTLFLRFQ